MKRRIFLGVAPTPDLLKELLSLQEEMSKNTLLLRAGRQCRWIERENIHLTLHFLGGLEESKLEELLVRLEELSSLPGLHQPLDRIVLFPRDGRARVGGIGAKEPVPPLFHVWNRAASLLRSLDIEVESRPYVPHASLVRFRSPMRIKADDFFPVNLCYPVEAVSVYESFAGQKPPQPYKIIKKFPLAQTP